MTDFEITLGLPPPQIKKHCVLAPFLTKRMMNSFGLKKLKKGKVYSAENHPLFTLICTGIGPSRMGDLVLSLKKTSCEKILLLGVCGLVKKKDGLDVGSLVCPYECLALESFTQVLSGRWDNSVLTFADHDLLNHFYIPENRKEISKVRCASFGSMRLEQVNMKVFQNRNIDVIDMECSACFSASRHINRKAMALFVISDIISEDSLFGDKDPRKNIVVQEGIQKASAITLEFIRTQF